MTSRDVDVEALGRLAVARSLRRHATLAGALATWGFVQYDPIRRPARAQDLILFQRVDGYRAGDLDRAYEAGDAGPLDEDHFYAYGVVTRPLAELLHPRPDRDGSGRPYSPEGLAADVLALVRSEGPRHPKEVSAVLGRSPAANDWGGLSAATTRALEELHYHGLLRVARRDRGVKVYAARRGAPAAGELSPEERLRRLVRALVWILAPVSVRGLRRTISLLLARTEGLEGRGTVIGELLAAGEVEPCDVDGERYLLPAGEAGGGGLDGSEANGGGLDDGAVRFLAPFDPVVWDRQRFEHLWGWPYRFEAYTPGQRRRYGYYALPLLWAGRPVGWVNLERTPSGRLDVDRGFAGRPEGARRFEQAFAVEVGRFETMLVKRDEEEDRWDVAPADVCS